MWLSHVGQCGTVEGAQLDFSVETETKLREVSEARYSNFPVKLAIGFWASSV
jgi:hypothetical protein